MIHFDCHAHVYETVDAIAGARYVPHQTAPLSVWCRHLQTHELMGGVIVQVSFLGNDNSELCAALAQLDRTRFAGVAVVPTSVGKDDIERLRAAGVRGFRWNLVRGAALPDLKGRQVRNFLSIIQRCGMHIELHLESPRLATFIGPLLDTGTTVVVDHLGLPSASNPEDDPWIKAMRQRKDLSGLYVKLSAPYRTPFACRSHALALHDLLPPDHLVWGSDWPHTQHEAVMDYDQSARWRSDCGLLSDTQAVEVLYGLSIDVE